MSVAKQKWVPKGSEHEAGEAFGAATVACKIGRRHVLI